jgi:hypothetical protein
MLWNFVPITRFVCVTCQTVIRKRSQESHSGFVRGQNGRIFTLNAIVTQSKNCPFGVNYIYILQQWHLTAYVSTTIVPVLSVVLVTFLSLIVVLNPSGNIWAMKLLLSVSDMFPLHTTSRMFHFFYSHPVLVLHSQQLL